MCFAEALKSINDLFPDGSTQVNDEGHTTIVINCVQYQVTCIGINGQSILQPAEDPGLVRGSDLSSEPTCPGDHSGKVTDIDLSKSMSNFLE